MARHLICRFLSAVAGVALIAAAGAVRAAEPGAGGMRQPLPDSRQGDFPRQNPSSAPGGKRPGPPERLQDSLRRDVVPGAGAPPRSVPDTRGLQFPEDARQRAGSTELTYRGIRYVVSGGRWYQQRGNDLVAVDPPAGVLVEELPEGHSMRWFGGVPYFYANGVYYVWRERAQRYEILQSPPTDERPPPGETRRDAAREPAITP